MNFVKVYCELNNENIVVDDYYTITINKEYTTENLIVLNVVNKNDVISTIKFDVDDSYSNLLDYCVEIQEEIQNKSGKALDVQLLEGFIIKHHMYFLLDKYKEELESNPNSIEDILNEVNLTKALAKAKTISKEQSMLINSHYLSKSEIGRYFIYLYNYLYENNMGKDMGIDTKVVKFKQTNSNELLQTPLDDLLHHMIYVSKLVDGGYQYDHAKEVVLDQNPLDIDIYSLLYTDVKLIKPLAILNFISPKYKGFIRVDKELLSHQFDR